MSVGGDNGNNGDSRCTPANFSLQDKTIWIAGEHGMVGRALTRALEQRGHSKIIKLPREAVDFRDQAAVLRFMREAKPHVVVVAAGKVGGIQANLNAPSAFLYDNTMIAANIIEAARLAGVEKLLYLGSSCQYPADAPLPLQPQSLLSGAFEPSNAPYALAKSLGVALCQTYRAAYGCDFISALPCNLYGPYDRFDAELSHVIPALMMKAHQAKLSGAHSFEAWGSGAPRREFLYVDDLAEACLILLERYSAAAPVNIGTGYSISIRDLAAQIAQCVGFTGEIVWNKQKPDGVYDKTLDVSAITQIGWRPNYSLIEGLENTYSWFLKRIRKS
ncbi:MAG: GDP-L-fucose synthase family protein [Alphaproteobacteria bacterium]